MKLPPIETSNCKGSICYISHQNKFDISIWVALSGLFASERLLTQSIKERQFLCSCLGFEARVCHIFLLVWASFPLVRVSFTIEWTAFPRVSGLSHGSQRPWMWEPFWTNPHAPCVKYSMWGMDPLNSSCHKAIFLSYVWDVYVWLFLLLIFASQQWKVIQFS